MDYFKHNGGFWFVNEQEKVFPLSLDLSGTGVHAFAHLKNVLELSCINPETFLAPFKNFPESFSRYSSFAKEAPLAKEY